MSGNHWPTHSELTGIFVEFFLILLLGGIFFGLIGISLVYLGFCFRGTFLVFCLFIKEGERA